MPYNTIADLPQAVKDKLKSPKKRRQWMHVWNSSYNANKDEDRAFASAWSAVKKGAGMNGKNDQVQFFLPITKVDKAKRTVSGYASTPCLDFEGESVSLDAIKAALPDYWQWRNIREMHKDTAVGVAQEANVDGKGLYLTAKIVDDSAWNKVTEGVYKGFSIGGRKLAKSGKEITKIDLVEISIVDRPANPECSFTVQKSVKPEERDEVDAYLLPVAKVATPRTPQQRAIRKLARVVGDLATAQPEPATEPVTKREFSPKERKGAAKSGAAMKDGSFPIQNEQDLKNAIQAIGRAKDPSAARAHIVSRAKALGKTDLLPKKWMKKVAKLVKAKSEAKAEKKAKKLAKRQADAANRMPAEPPLSLRAGDGAEAVGGSIRSSHEPGAKQVDDLLQKGGKRRLTKRERKLRKRMGVAGSLAYCFDSIRDAQRSLMYEAQTEGGDKKDVGLAQELGSIAQKLAAVIGRKAEHEGQEALDLSDAGDKNLTSLYGEDLFMSANGKTNKSAEAIGFDDILAKAVAEMLLRRAETPLTALKSANASLKKAKVIRKAVAESVEKLFDLHKKAHNDQLELVKAGKVKQSEVFDHQGAMRVLKTIFEAIGEQKTVIKAVRDDMAKAAGRISGQGGEVESGVSGVYDVPAGITTLSPGEMESLSPYQKLLKGRKTFTAAEAEMLVHNAEIEAENKLLKSLPAGPSGGREPHRFIPVAGEGGKNAPANDLFKGADVRRLNSDDPAVREQETSIAIGKHILSGGGKTVFAADFHGTAGVGGNS